MNKIKGISSEKLEKIKAKLTGDNKYLAGFKLELGKNMFILISFIYFTLYILVVGGWETAIMSRIIFVFYPVFVFFTLNLLYLFLLYNITVYSNLEGIAYTALKRLIFVIMFVSYIIILLFHITK